MINKIKTIKFFMCLAFIVFFISLFYVQKSMSAGLVGSAHDLSSQGYNGGLCRQCHVPHFKEDIRLYPSIPSVPPQWENISNSVRRLCLDCHGYDAIPSPDLPMLIGVTWGDPGTTPPRITDADGTKTLGGPYAADFHSGQERCTDCHRHSQSFLATCETCHGNCDTPEDLIGTIRYGAPDYINLGAGEYVRSWLEEYNSGTYDCSNILHANTHIEHLTGGGLTCANCHFSSIEDLDYTDGWSLLSGGDHLNGTIDLVGYNNGYNFNYVFTAGEKRCYESCHGTYTIGSPDAPQWGSSLGSGCFACHGGDESAAIPRPVETADSIPNEINQLQYENKGHGNSTTYLGSGNTGAGFLSFSADGASPGCYSTSGDATQPTDGCHYEPAQHFPTKSDTDPYRLGTYFSETGQPGRLDELCLYCHGEGQAGSTLSAMTHSHIAIDVAFGTNILTNFDWDAGDGYGRDNVKIGNGINTWESNEPKCVDCHDPHGDDNDYMVKNSISRIYGSTEYGSPRLDPVASGGDNNPNTTDYNLMAQVTFTIATPGSPIADDYYNERSQESETVKDSICQVCHTQTKVYQNMASADNLDTWDAGHLGHRPERMKCTVCHTHNKAMGIGCEECHGHCSPDDPNDPMYGAPDYPNAGPGYRPPDIPNGVCRTCHKPGKPNLIAPYGSYHQGFCQQPPVEDILIQANSHYEHMVSGRLECKDCHYKSIRDTNKADGWRVVPAVRAPGNSPNPVIDGYHFNSFGGFLNDFRWATNWPGGFWNGIHPVEVNSEFFGRFGYLPYMSEPYEGHEGYYKFKDTGEALETNKRCFESCHGSYNKYQGAIAPQWGGSLGSGCFACHSGAEDPDVPRPVETADGGANGIDQFQYENTGHGATLAYNSGNAGAGFNDYSAALTSPGCYSTSGNSSQPVNGCHYESAQHYPLKSDSDPYRLGSYFSNITIPGITNELCLYCHGVGQGGSSLEAETHSATVTGSSLDWDNGTGYDRNGINIGYNTWGTNEPECVDCHDPHGDDNDYMIKNSISRIYGSTNYGGPRLDPAQHAGNRNVPNYINEANYNPDLMVPVAFALTAGGRAGDYYNLPTDGLDDGICQICHTQTSLFNNLASGSVQAHGFITDTGVRCTSCHPHVVGFKAACDACHGFPPPDQQHTTHVIDYGFNDCYTCHYKFNDITVNTNGHPSQTYIDTGVKDTIFVRMPQVIEDEPYYFPGGTMVTNGSAVPTLQAGGEVTCNVGCHNPIITMAGSLARERGITVNWQADLNNVVCTSCHNDITNKFTDAGTHSSKHPANPANNDDCIICHSFIKPKDKITITDNGRSVDVYHTNHKFKQGSLPTWPQDTFPLLLSRDDASSIPFKINVTEVAGAYSYSADYSYEDNMTTFCLDCHDGDDSVGAVFSSGGGAPDIERGTFWDNSAHATGGMTGIEVGCFGDSSFVSGTGCHANAHGSKKLSLLGPPDTAATSPDYEEEEEGFCYGCHQSGKVINYALSTKSDLSYTMADNIQDIFSYTSTHPVKDSEQPTVNGSKVEIECTSCHSPHWATGKYSESDEDKTPVTLPTKLEAFEAGQTVTDAELLWGDEASEKAVAYAAQFLGTGGFDKTRETSGYCYDRVIDEPAVYRPTNSYGESTGTVDYNTFCFDCHKDPNKVRVKYLFDTGLLDDGSEINDWETVDAHGGMRAGAPYYNSAFSMTHCSYPTDLTSQGTIRTPCSEVDPVTGEHDGAGYQMWTFSPYTAKDRIVGINFVLMCTDCHEAHGTVLEGIDQYNGSGSLIRSSINTGDTAPIASQTWQPICLSCHRIGTTHHLQADGSLKPESICSGYTYTCHSNRSIHKMPNYKGTENLHEGPILYGDYKYMKQFTCDDIEDGLVLWWDLNEGTGVSGDNIEDKCRPYGSESPYCGIDFRGTICDPQAVSSWQPSIQGEGDCDPTGNFSFKIDKAYVTWRGTWIDLYHNTNQINGNINVAVLLPRYEMTVEADINPYVPVFYNWFQYIGLTRFIFDALDTFDHANYSFMIQRDAVVDRHDPGASYPPFTQEEKQADKLIFAIKVEDSLGNAYVPPGKDASAIHASLSGMTYVRSGDLGYETVLINNETWQHVAATFDGRYIRLYINGALAGETDLGQTYYMRVRTRETNDMNAGNSDVTLMMGSGLTPAWMLCGNASAEANGTFYGEIDNLKIYNKARTPEEIQCAMCHRTFPPNSGSHLTHLEDDFGPKDDCDYCHGTGANQGTHIGHQDCDLNQIEFADGADLTNTTVCDNCHGNDPAKGLASESNQAKAHWDTPGTWVSEVGYCENCHDATPSVVNTTAGTGGVDVTAQNEDGDYNPIDFSGTYGFHKNGHGRDSNPYIGHECTTCHEPYGPHIDGNGDVKLRMINEPSTGQPYAPNTNDNSCFRCHDGVTATMASAHSNIDNPVEGGFIKYEEDFGYVRCIDCHNPHGTTNIKMINSAVKKRDTLGNITALLLVTFTNQTGVDSYDEGSELIGAPDDNDDLCVVCHIDSGMLHHIGGKHESIVNNDCSCLGQDRRDEKCTDCHLHEYDANILTQDGFMPKAVEYSDDCLFCHTFPGTSMYDIDGQFDGIGAISDGLIVSQHLVRYIGPDYSSKDNNECKKCHGDTHPTRDATVVNVDDGITTYSTSDCGGRTPDDLSPFCFSCHDGIADTGIAADIQFNGTLPTAQMAPRGQETKLITDPWLPPYVSSTSYYTTGMGSTISLSGRATGPNMQCTDCHENHSSDTSHRLAKSFLGGSEGTVSFNYDKDTSSSYDDWCTYTCHFSLEPSIMDHTFGESRDGTIEPEAFLPTHPTSMAIPSSPLIKQYTQVDPAIQKYIDSSTTIICISCHDPHGIDPAGEASPDKQMLRLKWTESGINDGLCAACHN